MSIPPSRLCRATVLNSTWSPRFVRKALLRRSLFHWAYYGLFRALRAAFVRPTGCAASFALIGLPLRLFPPLAAAKLRPHWAYFALFRPLGARFVRPKMVLPACCATPKSDAARRVSDL